MATPTTEKLSSGSKHVARPMAEASLASSNRRGLSSHQSSPKRDARAEDFADDADEAETAPLKATLGELSPTNGAKLEEQVARAEGEGMSGKPQPDPADSKSGKASRPSTDSVTASGARLLEDARLEKVKSLIREGLHFVGDWIEHAGKRMDHQKMPKIAAVVEKVGNKIEHLAD